MQNIDEIENLIKLISRLPGLGPKSAKRIVLKLINNREEIVKPMANSLVQVYKNVTRCNFCGSLKSNSVGCQNCENIKEKFNKICVVEDIADQWSIENSKIFKGYFGLQSKPFFTKESRLTMSFSLKSFNLERLIIEKDF